MPFLGYNEPFPRIKIVKEDGTAADKFIQWLEESLLRRLEASPVLSDDPIPFTEESTGPTGTLGGALSAGAYHINGYAQVITPAGVASSLTLTIAWTFGGIAQTFSFPAMNGNLVTTNQSQDLTIQIDPSTTITYTYAYVSNPAAAMEWSGFLSATLIAPLG